MKLEDAIEVVLRKHGSLSCADIANYIQRERMAKLGGKTPAATIGSVMIRAPKRFERVSKGVYDVKNSKRIQKHDDSDLQSVFQPFVKYQYTEQSVGYGNSGYYHIAWENIGEMFVGEKLILSKALSSKFSGSRRNNFPSVYVLGIDVQQKEVYVGESYETLVRISHWKNNKKYKYAAVFHADTLQNDNMRRNLEHVLIEWFKKAGWNLQNQNSNPRAIMQRDMYTYNHIKEVIPTMGYKIICLFEMCDDANPNVKDTKKDKEQSEQKPERQTWSNSLKQADGPTRELASEIIDDLHNNVGGTVFESAWLYFGDRIASRKKAFVALASGKHKLELVFLWPDDRPLPKGARRLKPFVLSQKSECRLPLGRTNLQVAVEIAARSRDYLRSLNETTK